MIVNIEDLRVRARRRLPRAVFDFIDGGAEDEISLRANRTAFQRLTFRPRVLVDASAVDQSATVLGQPLTTPLFLAPTGLCGMAAPRAEVLAGRAAVARGIPFTLSSMAAVSIEDTMREAPGPHWFQLYVWRDRDLTRSLVDRAAAAGYRALVLTVDVQVLGQRERDLRNGATIPPRVTWRIEFVNVACSAGGAHASGPFSLSSFVNAQFDPTVSWKDLTWFRSLWSGPL